MLKRILKWLKIKTEPKPIVSLVVVMTPWYISKIEINEIVFDFGHMLSPSEVLNVALDYIYINHKEKVTFTDPEWNTLFAALNSRSPAIVNLTKVQVDISFKKTHQIQL